MESIRDQIEKRAYELFLARSGENGYAIQDWLQAEKELHTEINRKKPNKQVRVKPAEKPIKKTFEKIVEKPAEESIIVKAGKREEVVKGIKDEPKRSTLRNGFFAFK
jgi:hypothetical protein